MSKEYFLFDGICELVSEDKLVLLTKGNIRNTFNIKSEENNIKPSILKKIKPNDIVFIRAYTENKYGGFNKNYLDKISMIKRRDKFILKTNKGRPSK